MARAVPGSAARVGTGPYRVTAFDSGESLRLRRFERYYGRHRFVRDAVFRRFADVAAAGRLLAAEPLTLVIDPPRALIEQVRCRPDLEVSLDATPTYRHLERGSDFYLFSWVSGLESAKSLYSFLHT